MSAPTTHLRAAETDWRIADLMPRTAASFLDFVAILVLLLPVLLALRLVEEITGYAAPVPVVLGLVPYIVALLYLGLTEGRRGDRNGQTWAKQLADIRTVRATTGAPIGRGRAWVRAGWTALLLPMSFPALQLVEWATHDTLDGRIEGAIVNLGTLLALLGASLLTTRRTYYDLACGTAVIAHGEEPEERRQHRSPTPTAPKPTTSRPSGSVVFRPKPLNLNEILFAAAWTLWVIYYAFFERTT